MPSTAASWLVDCSRSARRCRNPQIYTGDIQEIMKSSLCIMLVTTTAMALAAAETVNFDNMKGGPPPGWTATQTGSGTAKWAIEKDESAPSKPNVLKQSGQATFPVCIEDDTSLKDGFGEVKFKRVSGRE